MQRARSVRLVLLLWAALLVVLPLQAQPSAQQQIELFSPLFLTFPISDTAYQNPFDAAEIEVLGIFRKPSGSQAVIPGFWMIPYSDQCSADCSVADYRPSGDPQWQIRITPDEIGLWTYTLQVRRAGALVESADGAFEVVPSDRDGFIGVGRNGRYFQFDSGRPYFPVGLNLKWSWNGIGGVRRYQQWLRELSASGVNYARLFIDTPWFINLEWFGPAGDYSAAQRSAAELDAILETASEVGVYLQVVLLWHQSLRVYTGSPVVIPTEPARPDTAVDWDDHPYNVLNGGPLSGPGAFFTNAAVQELFRRRLRYIVARWGFSPQVFAWEIVDRVDRLPNYLEQVTGEWLRSVTSYLREVDQHGHLITAGSQQPVPLIYDNPLLDFAPFEFYQRRPLEPPVDQEQGVIQGIRQYRQTSRSPVLLSAFSLNPWYEPAADDPAGVHVQTTLWTSVLAGAAGAAASDWWDTYLLPGSMQRFFSPLAAFTAGIQWNALDLQPAQSSLVSDDKDQYQPLRLEDFFRRFAVLPSQAVVRQITPDGVFPSLADQPSYLYGQVYNSRFSQAHRYEIVVPVDTYFELRVRAVSEQAGARLVVRIDDVTALELDLRPGSRDVTARLPLRAGEHLITLDNIGNDWLDLAHIEIGHFIPPARVLTLRDSQAGVVLAWLQHAAYTWEQVASAVARKPLAMSYRLDRLPAGRYVVETWDPLSGAVLGEELLRVGSDGVLTVELLPFDTQIALRALRQSDIPAQAAPPLPTDTPFAAPPSNGDFTVTPTAVTATSSPTAQPILDVTPVSLTPTLTRTAFATGTVTSFPSAEATVIVATPRAAVTRPAGTRAAPGAVYTNTPRPTATSQP